MKKDRRILVCWAGKTDCAAAEQQHDKNLGPIRTLTSNKDYPFDAVHILYTAELHNKIETLNEWLKHDVQTVYPLVTEIEDPTDYKSIYDVASRLLMQVRSEYGTDAEYTIHLSPGTPTMQAIWIILSKTRFPSRLVQTRRPTDKGELVSVVSMPFNLSFQKVSASPAALVSKQEGPFLFCSELAEVYACAEKMAPFDEPIMINGETGTGKELIARHIHDCSGRSGKFIPINCGAIPSELFESEFFGHAKGAFTGAMAEKAGLFEQANKGTLFLDEVGELPLQMQVKLLRVLQERKIRKIGKTEETKVDVRILAATHRDLFKMIESGEFRSDLYYRLNSLPLKLPALREVKDAIPELIENRFAKLRGTINKNCKLSAEASEVLCSYNWPGNIRELEMNLKRLLILTEGNMVTRKDIDSYLIFQNGDASGDIEELLMSGLSLKDATKEFKAKYVQHVLSQARSQSEAAKILETSQPTLSRIVNSQM